MAKTFVLFIALLITGLTSFFSLTNLNKMKAERQKIHRLEGDIDKTMQDITSTRASIAERRGEVDAENRKRGQQTADRDGLLGDIASLERQIPKLEEQINGQMATIKKFEDIINDLKAFFAEMNVNDLEELNDKIKQLANDTVAREKELAETQALVEAANAANNKTDGQLSSARERQMVRSSGIELNTREGVIMAVNHDWGFVVINSGTNQGFKGEHSLVVKRGDTFIAKLAITSLNKNQMVADIVPKSMAPGLTVMPGDRVMLLTPNR